MSLSVVSQMQHSQVQREAGDSLYLFGFGSLFSLQFGEQDVIAYSTSQVEGLGVA